MTTIRNHVHQRLNMKILKFIDTMAFPSMLFGMAGTLLYSILWTFFRIDSSELMYCSLFAGFGSMSFTFRKMQTGIVRKTLCVFTGLSSYGIAISLLLFDLIAGEYRIMPFMAYSVSAGVVVVYAYFYLKKNNLCRKI